MQAAIETAGTQHAGDVVWGFESAAGFLKVAAIFQRGDERGGHHLGTAHLALRVFSMTHGLQQVVTKAKHCYNLIVYGLPPLRCRFGHPQLYAQSMDIQLRCPR
jgi:hypothetical protein